MSETADLAIRLASVTALMVVVGLAVKTWARRSGTATGLRVYARAAIHKGAVVGVVEVGKRRFLVGATDQTVTLLAELDSEDLPPSSPRMGATDRIGSILPPFKGRPRVRIH